ncbi:hypothetical protein VSDG_06425 [Cytospora chrysosperma]|uniref:Mid2 domain-containing protein n=1 Tax=Cytospora chrysosperma TaxID=252740 RepID=A0A423VLB8_CYTCH|nr:hypothetical protein VSDG_06425 [Valsa sordida]
MRIYSSTIWLLSASLAGTTVASEITFDIDGFIGAEVQSDNGMVQTTILNITQLEKGNNGGRGWMITWSPAQANNGPTIQSVLLATRGSLETSIAYGTSSQGTISGAPSLLLGRNPIPEDGVSQDTPVFSVDFVGGSLTLENHFVTSTLANFQKEPLFFQIEWTNDTQSGHSYSLPWAVADIAEASGLLNLYPSLVTSGSPVYTDGLLPSVSLGAIPTTMTGTGISNDTSSSSTFTVTTASSSASSSSSKGKSRGISTGAIVGIAIGIVAALMIASVVAGCLCFRRRKSRGANGEDGSRDVRAMQDIMAEKEARVGILEGDQTDTPYSERAAPNPLGGGLGLTGMNESGVDMGFGQAVPGDGVVPCEGHYTDGNDRNSGVYAGPVVVPASGTNGSPTHTHPSYSTQQRPSVPCTSTQQDRAFTPQQQEHHNHMVEGSGPVHQEQQFNDQPVFPDSSGGTPRLREAALGSRSATPSGISGRYAHLVEEGMTDEEIRRLEEEERQVYLTADHAYYSRKLRSPEK